MKPPPGQNHNLPPGRPPQMIMARFIRAVQRTLRLPPLQRSSKTLIHGLQLPSLQSHNATSKFIFQTRSYQNSFEILKSPFESNVLRILRNEIEYLTEDGPPNQVFPTPCLAQRNEGKEEKIAIFYFIIIIIILVVI